MELSAECKEVVDSVRLLASHNTPSMFWVEMDKRTEQGPDYVSNMLKRWLFGAYFEPQRHEMLLTLLSEAFDIQSQSIYGVTWDELAGEQSWAIICFVGRV